MGRTKTYQAKDILKRQIAEELGYMEKVNGDDWGDLTSIESGRVGGMVNRYMRANKWI